MAQDLIKATVMYCDNSGIWKDMDGDIVYPIELSYKLDETLDMAFLTIRGSSVPVLSPTIKVRATVTYYYGPENSSFSSMVYEYVVSSDQSTEYPIGKGKYTHKLSLIEPTKLLEGIVCQTISFTNQKDTAHGSDIWSV